MKRWLITLLALIPPTIASALLESLGVGPVRSHMAIDPQGYWVSFVPDRMGIDIFAYNKEFHRDFPSTGERIHSVVRFLSFRYSKKPFYLEFGYEFDDYPISPPREIEFQDVYKNKTYQLALGGSMDLGNITFGLRLRGLKHSKTFEFEFYEFEEDTPVPLPVVRRSNSRALSLDVGFHYKGNSSTVFIEVNNFLSTDFQYFLQKDFFFADLMTGLPRNVRMGLLSRLSPTLWLRFEGFYLFADKIPDWAPFDEDGKGYYSLLLGPYFQLTVSKSMGSLSLIATGNWGRTEGHADGIITKTRDWGLSLGLILKSPFGTSKGELGWDNAARKYSDSSQPILFWFSHRYNFKR